MSRYPVGSYVACAFGDMWWVGVVEQLLPATDEYAIKFMQHVDPTRVERCFLQFPEEEDDIQAISHTEVMMKVSKPIGTVCGSKWCQTLPAGDIKKILNKFDMM